MAEEIVRGDDVFAVLPKSGKSLYYIWVSPFFCDEFRYDGLSSVVLVITPLTAIMKDQVLDTFLAALLIISGNQPHPRSTIHQHKNCYRTGPLVLTLRLSQGSGHAGL